MLVRASDSFPHDPMNAQMLPSLSLEDNQFDMPVDSFTAQSMLFA